MLKSTAVCCAVLLRGTSAHTALVIPAKAESRDPTVLEFLAARLWIPALAPADRASRGPVALGRDDESQYPHSL